jgi:hypothetical protein
MGTKPTTREEPFGDARDLLMGFLAQALGDETEAKLAVAVGLRAAGRQELPVLSSELLAFVERHLHAELRERIGGPLAAAMMDDLEAALAHASPTSPPPPSAGEEGEGVERPTVRAPETDVPPAAVVPSITPARLPSRVDEDQGALQAAGGRAVLVIDADRMARVDLCRALIHAACDVTVRDTCAGVVTGADQFDVIVADIEGVAIEELIDAFASDPPDCAVIAWTKAVDRAEAMFRAAGLDSFSVVAKAARPDSVVAAVDQLLVERAMSAPREA